MVGGCGVVARPFENRDGVLGHELQPGEFIGIEGGGQGVFVDPEPVNQLLLFNFVRLHLHQNLGFLLSTVLQPLLDNFKRLLQHVAQPLFFPDIDFQQTNFLRKTYYKISRHHHEIT
jgi:hypothetical protein